LHQPKKFSRHRQTETKLCHTPIFQAVSLSFLAFKKPQAKAFKQSGIGLKFSGHSNPQNI
jgi:hypothetical protein